ncbi:potassium channel family protein [Tomitella biformata]|uniref:potassium channel family protein n=1 Tax=Tomitella biformata TaxID=630403 RepID=UPI0004646490|nr:potassium channel family protein [Tomitella biformata]
MPPQAWKLTVLLVLRVTLSWSLLLTAYYLIPAKNADGSDLPWVILALCAFGAVVALMVPAIIRSPHPLFRAIEALALIIPLYLLIFARIYLSNSLTNPAGFTELLDHSTALYFTVTVFATVGFGDIIARTDGLRLLVTVQMLGNLVVLGVVVRLIVVAARRGVARLDADGQGDGDQPDPDG